MFREQELLDEIQEYKNIKTNEKQSIQQQLLTYQNEIDNLTMIITNKESEKSIFHQQIQKLENEKISLQQQINSLTNDLLEAQQNNNIGFQSLTNNYHNSLKTIEQMKLDHQMIMNSLKKTYMYT